MKNINKNRIFRFNRRIRCKTDYRLRLRLLKSGLTRAVVRKTNKNMIVQIVDYEKNGDKIVTSAISKDLKKYGFNLNTGNLVASYLTGYLAGKRALKKKVSGEIIIDLGLQRSIYGSRLYSAVKGLVDSGMNVKVSEVVFPSEERLNGEHLNTKEDVKKIIEQVKSKIDKELN
jgi:large subunit ribosomal protein L18